MPASDARISPTAHYTSYVWFANGMSHRALTSRLGQVLYRTLAPMNAAHELLARGPNLEMMLLTRHRMIDHLLERAITAGRVGQVVEIAAGMSPRGYRFARRHRERGLTYVEADLPEMVEHKRRALAAAGLGGPNHQVVHVDALARAGEGSLAAVAGALLAPERGTAVITEGLLGYFDEPSLRTTWENIAAVLAQKPHGMYLFELYAGADARSLAARGFELMLSAFTRGKLYRHWEDDPERAIPPLRAAGFRDVTIHAPRDFEGELDLPGVERGGITLIFEART